MVRAMALRTAPCPTCGNTIVFGERRCRGCGMTFDYGPSPPPEPTAAQIFDALADVGAPQAPAPSSSPAPPTATPDVPTLAGLDTGRFEVGEVPIDDVPGLIDSTLFKAMTPEHVDVTPIAGLELTMQGGSDVPVAPAPIPGLEARADAVGTVDVAPVPGLFGSDLFRTDVDIGAGAAAAGDVLEVSPNAARRRTRVASAGPRRVVCASCSTVHVLARCPSCGTAAPAADD
jgi:predicted RNA-binding Zn-ribbon protein involved in translation (DUF1610 family)